MKGKIKMNKTMPFGKYKGKSLQEIPDSYIAWLMKSCELKEPLKTWVEDLVWEKISKNKETLMMEWIEDNYVKRSSSYGSYNDSSFSDYVQDDYDCPYDEWDGYGNLCVDFGF